MPPASALEDTFHSYLTIVTRVTTLQNLNCKGCDEGCMGGCPICANIPDAPECHIAVAADAVTKASSFANTATATKSLPSRINQHFAKVELSVQQLQAEKALSLDRFLSTDSQDMSEEEDDRECSTALTCSRPESKAPPGSCDIFGVVGMVCMHGIPLLGLFCNMPTPEQFLYYLLILKILLEQGCPVNDVYIDFACKVKHYNCGRFAFNAGCRVGEHTEQLWSMLKDLVGKLRYAKRATRQDLIDACLSLIARLKVPQMPKLLKQRWLRNCKALDKYTREFNERISAAAADGVVDVQMAMNAYIEHLCPSSLLPASDTDASKAKLAELLLKLWSVDISKKLRVPRRWQRHDQVFQEAHTLLVQSKMAECRNRAEQCVLELREIHNSRQEEGAASKVTQASRSAEKRKRSKLSKLALEME
eukprot:scaffold14837_cov32-Tisochrysis_lutea.AAC.1